MSKVRRPTPLFETDEDVRHFAAALPTQALGKPLKFVPTTRSTNDLALEAARAGAAHGTVYIADQQTGGRGRSGRSWHSPANRGILMSLIIRPRAIAPSDLGWIPLLAGLACARALRESAGVSATIKWPNDVVLPGDETPGWRKLGGILCESSLTPGAPTQNFVVIGIGLNVNHVVEDFPPHAKAPPTSIRLETGKEANRRSILAALLCELEASLHLLETPHGREQLQASVDAALKSWWTSDRLLNLNPQAGDASDVRIEGTFAGLDTFGRLRLYVLPSGDTQTLADAEIIGIRAI